MTEQTGKNEGIAREIDYKLGGSSNCHETTCFLETGKVDGCPLPCSDDCFRTLRHNLMLEYIQEALDQKDAEKAEEVARAHAALHWKQLELEKAEAQLTTLKASLENCRLLAAKQAHAFSGSITEDKWRAILRFCKEAGIVGSILRDTAALNQEGVKDVSSI